MCGFSGVIGDKLSREEIRLFHEKGSWRGRDSSEFMEGRLPRSDKTWYLAHHLLQYDYDFPSLQPAQLKNVIAVFNGEIFNVDQLAEKFFPSQESALSEIELIAMGYRLVGPDFFLELEGFFAIAIIDLMSEHVVLARDPTGQKPLFYQSRGFVGFSSSIESFTNGSSELDLGSVYQYCRVGFCDTDKSLIKNVHQVPSGSVVTIDLETKNVEVCNLRRLFFSRDKNDSLSVIDSLRLSIDSSMQRCRSPGVLLSGGLDSSIIAILANRDSKIPSFSCKYVNIPDSDRLNADFEMAKRLTSDLEIPLIEVTIDGESQQFRHYFDEFVYLSDQPIINFTALSTYIACRAAKNFGVDMLLSGDGADEIFFGYGRYRKAILKLQSQASCIFGNELDRSRIYMNSISILRHSELTSIASETFQLSGFFGKQLGMDLVEPSSKFLPEFLCQMDRQFWLPLESNRRVDQAGAAAQIEIRAPFQRWEFLSHHLRNNFGFSNLFEEKIRLKREVRSLVPDYVINRKKTGWNAPDSKWFRMALRPVVEHYLDGNLTRRLGLFDEAKVSNLVKDHIGGAYWRNELRIALSLQMWMHKNDLQI